MDLLNLSLKQSREGHSGLAEPVFAREWRRVEEVILDLLNLSLLQNGGGHSGLAEHVSATEWRRVEEVQEISAIQREYVVEVWAGKTTGSVADISRSGRPHSATCETNINLVLKNKKEGCLEEIKIPRTSIQRMLNNLGYKPYIPKLIHVLHEDGWDRRMEFCKKMLEMKICLIE
ncbi:hypothetical protein LAZ67_6003271 [Cordylochernes scorpioides]|uniref:Uncharacterized protein n=1 Tax=Cordylochernes scorpioides TaxID=51811 RepID=A0ABY6KLG6_9ARAC|nr:hypothetical protein LAZ67_6003271 [Cordylochernes scorpioides]